MHEIRYLTFGARYTPKGIQRVCDKISKANSDYRAPLYNAVRFPNVLCKSRKEAEDWIDEHDRHDYDSVAIQYKENRKKYWLAKIEYHV